MSLLVKAVTKTKQNKKQTNKENTHTHTHTQTKENLDFPAIPYQKFFFSLRQCPTLSCTTQAGVLTETFLLSLGNYCSPNLIQWKKEQQLHDTTICLHQALAFPECSSSATLSYWGGGLFSNPDFSGGGALLLWLIQFFRCILHWKNIPSILGAAIQSPILWVACTKLHSLTGLKIGYPTKNKSVSMFSSPRKGKKSNRLKKLINSYLNESTEKHL